MKKSLISLILIISIFQFNYTVCAAQLEADQVSEVEIAKILNEHTPYFDKFFKLIGFKKLETIIFPYFEKISEIVVPRIQTLILLNKISSL